MQGRPARSGGCRAGLCYRPSRPQGTGRPDSSRHGLPAHQTAPSSAQAAAGCCLSTIHFHPSTRTPVHHTLSSAKKKKKKKSRRSGGGGGGGEEEPPMEGGQELGRHVGAAGGRRRRHPLGVVPPDGPALGQGVVPAAHDGAGRGAALGRGGDGGGDVAAGTGGTVADGRARGGGPAGRGVLVGAGALGAAGPGRGGGSTSREGWAGAGAIVAAGPGRGRGRGRGRRGGAGSNAARFASVGNGTEVLVGPCGWAIVGGADLADGRVPGQQPPAVEADDGYREPRKRGKKGRKRAQGYLDTEYSPAPENVYTDLVAALKLCKSYEELALELTALNRVPPQRSMADIPEIFCNSDLSPEHLSDFLRRKQDFYLNTYPRKLAVRLEDGSLVVVCITPNKEPNQKERTYHVVCLTRTSDDTKAKILVENYSGYAVAFKVVYQGEMDLDIPWCDFGNEALDEDLLGKSVKIQRGPNYSPELESICIEDGIGDKIISYMATFRARPGNLKAYDQFITAFGNRMIDTVIAFACEAPRFGLAEHWVVHVRGRIPWNLSECLKDWLGTCKCIHLLLRYLEEKKLSLVAGDMMSRLAEESESTCTTWWKERQTPLLHTEMQFLEIAPVNTKQEMPELNRLAGTHLKLLRNDEVLWDQIVMRQLGYNGPWMNRIGSDDASDDVYLEAEEHLQDDRFMDLQDESDDEYLEAEEDLQDDGATADEKLQDDGAMSDEALQGYG